MAISVPRIDSISSSERSARSRPLNRMRPPAIRLARGSNRMIESAVIDLPEPDSPTMPSVSPASTVSDTWSTARISPCFNAMCVCTFSSSRRWVTRTSGPEPWIQRVAQGVAEQVEAVHRDRDRGPRHDGQPGVVRQECGTRADHLAPIRRRELGAEAKERKCGLGEDRKAGRKRHLDDHRVQQVGDEVADDEAERVGAKRACRDDELHLLELQHDRPYEPRVDGDRDDSDRDYRVAKPRPQRGHDGAGA